MSLVDQIKAVAAEERAFQYHPLGIYKATVDEVRQREVTVQGYPTTVYDIVIKSSVGTAKVGIFKTTVADVEDGYRGTLDTSQAEERYVKSMARLCRLYTDLGLKAPSNPEVNEFEAECYERLGELRGCACEISVKANKKDPGKEPVVYVNAPNAEPVNAKPAARAAGPTARPQTAARKPAAPAPASVADLDDIPF